MQRDGWYVWGDGENIHIWTRHKGMSDTKAARGALYQGVLGMLMPEELFEEMAVGLYERLRRERGLEAVQARLLAKYGPDLDEVQRVA